MNIIQHTKPASVAATKSYTSTLITAYVLAIIVMGCVSLVFGLLAVNLAVKDAIERSITQHPK